MKNKIKYFLSLVVSMILFISIFKDNFNLSSSSYQAINTNISEGNGKIMKHKNKIIYLTFDDGPSYKVTTKVLDILKENDVKATFFLIGDEIEGREDVVKRIYEEGNSIGLHTCTHVFNRIYCSEDKFIQEMLLCRNQINNVIGIEPNIIRFPGGSSRHLSNKYLDKLHENKLMIYDWNMDNTDGLNPKLPPYYLYKKAITGSKELENVILLLHCTDMNTNTCEALPEIIKYYKLHDYEFKTISEDTPELYFPIKNK